MGLAFILICNKQILLYTSWEPQFLCLWGIVIHSLMFGTSDRGDISFQQCICKKTTDHNLCHTPQMTLPQRALHSDKVALNGFPPLLTNLHNQLLIG